MEVAEELAGIQPKAQPKDYIGKETFGERGRSRWAGATSPPREEREEVMTDEDGYLRKPIEAYPAKELIAFDFQTTDDWNQFLDLLLEKDQYFVYTLPGGASVIFHKRYIGELKRLATKAGLGFSETPVVSPSELSPEKYKELQQQRAARGRPQVDLEARKRMIEELQKR